MALSYHAPVAVEVGPITEAWDLGMAPKPEGQVPLRVLALHSAKGARIKGAVCARTVVDGPFAESKELIAGFMLLSFPSKAEAVSWAQRYADVVGTPEVDVREVS